MHTSTLSHEGVNQCMYRLICISEALQLKLELLCLVPTACCYSKLLSTYTGDGKGLLKVNN